jgi:DNA-binding transcriptional ArsR family regulator
VHLRGRGLLLALSLFSNGDPGLFTPWNDDPALLIYPVDLDAPTALRLWRRDESGDRALAGLLGTTRAAALRVIADGCTTTELARRLGISPGGASQHATVLRDAGLVVSRRFRNSVRHTLTGLGVDLLNAT